MSSTREVIDSIKNRFQEVDNLFDNYNIKELPDFHLIFSEMRGIFFTAYFIPKDTTKDTSSYSIPSAGRTTAEILGIETANDEILSQFERCFEFYLNQTHSISENHVSLVDIIKDLRKYLNP